MAAAGRIFLAVTLGLGLLAPVAAQEGSAALPETVVCPGFACTALEAVKERVQKKRLPAVFPGATRSATVTPEVVIFEDAIPGDPDNQISVRTKFFLESSTVQKSVMVGGRGDGAPYWFQARLAAGDRPYRGYSWGSADMPWVVYENGRDLLAYVQQVDDEGSVELKEWIYASEPNCPQGSCYRWEYEAMGRRARLQSREGGMLGLHLDIIVNGLDPEAPGYDERRRHVIDTVHKAIPTARVDESPLVGILEPVVYWTQDGVRKEGKYEVVDRRAVDVVIDEPRSSYPLLVDPALVWDRETFSRK